METILDRQLRRLGLDADTVPNEAQWRALLERVRRTYGDFERDRYTIERSLELMSSEMLALNNELRAASAQQQNEQERLRAVIGALGDGLGALDAEGRLVLLNVAGERLVGAGAAQLVGTRLLERFELHVQEGAEARRIEHAALLARIARADALRDEGGLLHALDGRVVPVDCVLNPVVQRGVVAGAVLLFRDVTAQRQADEELRRARRDADAANRAKSEFLAVMSHEIRTPMNAVIGMTDLLLETALSDEQRDHAETVRRSGEALLAVINDILDFSKVESGHLALEEIDFDLRATLDDVAALFRELALRKGVELIVRASPDTPRRLRGDPSRLRQILVNLVGNALKFTHAGEVVVRASHTPLLDAEHLLRFAVRDSGVGISPTALAGLFQPFSQGDTSTTRRYGGTGLGLAICRRLTALMGGEIAVESVLGGGSTFRFTVRLRAPLGEGPSARSLAPPARVPYSFTGVEGARVLVVEDNVVNQKVITRMLQRFGLVIEVANDGVEALEALARGTYALVLMDCQMPEMDGYAATRCIREAEVCSNVRTPIVAMTAHALQGERERCLEAGMDDYLSKPIALPPLVAMLNRWLGPPPA